LNENINPLTKNMESSIWNWSHVKGRKF
jgi:hypothetical protein